MTQAVQHVGFTRSGKAVQVPILSDEPQNYHRRVHCTHRLITLTPCDKKLLREVRARGSGTGAKLRKALDLL